ncbi:FGGY family carbohydrate kinase [Micromonospora sp. NPDC049662]|uniref:FGGY family carbohydrate kinase n=1 Tax=Micromonospora sp. NPDC049662 TaxID=3155397 RepID=UPI0034398530
MAFVGVDFGTSRIKAALVNSDGALAASISVPYSEIDSVHTGPERWLVELRLVLSRLLAGSLHIGAVKGLAITAMSPNVVYKADSQQPDHIYFYDDRAYSIELELDELLQSPKWANEVLSKLVYLSGRQKSGSQARWYTTQGYLAHLLTGVYVIDSVVLTECGSLVGDNATWNYSVMDRLGLGHVEMPSVMVPASVLGPVVDTSIVELVGAECLLAVGSSDTVGTLVGSGTRGLNDFLVYYGTFNSASRVMASTNTLLREPLTQPPFDWFCSLPRSGHQLDGLVRTLFGPGTGAFADFFAEAGHAVAGSLGVRFVHTPLGAGSTVSTHPKGAVFGIGLDAGRAEIARSFLESFGFALRAFAESAGVPLLGLLGRAAGGGAQARLWRQIVSDIAQIPQTRVAAADEGLGSALIAVHAVEGATVAERFFEPFLSKAEVTDPDVKVRDLYEEAYQDYRHFFGFGEHLVI